MPNIYKISINDEKNENKLKSGSIRAFFPTTRRNAPTPIGWRHFHSFSLSSLVSLSLTFSYFLAKDESKKEENIKRNVNYDLDAAWTQELVRPGLCRHHTGLRGAFGVARGVRFEL